MFIAAAAIAFAGCQPNEIEKIEQTGNGTHTVTFTAELGNTTKTTMSEGSEAATFSWSSVDENNFVAYENEVPATETIGVIEGKIMKVTATFEDGATTPFTYTAILNGSMPSQQVLYDGKYDETSDVLVAKPVNSETIPDEFTFQFKRVVALNKMTIKGLGADEIVSKVVISSDKAIAGDYDVKNDCWVEYVDGTPSNTITLDGGEDEGVLSDEAGNAVVYFNCVPVEGAQLTIDVTTDKATYSKTFSKTISLLEGQLNKFGVTVVEPAYVKVTSNLEDWSGEYLLVYEDGNTGYCWTGVDAADCYATAIINSNEISEIPDGAVTLTIASINGGYSIKVNGGNNNGKYIKGTSDSNALGFDVSAQLNTINYKDGSVEIVSNTSVMRYNSASNNNRFRYFKSATYTSQQPVQLYKFNGTPAPEKQSQTLSFPQESYEINLGETFTAPVLSGAQTAVTYSSSDEEVATVNETSGAVEIISAGEVTITATAEADDTYKQGTASYTITIIDPSAGALTTIEQIFTSSAEKGNYKVIFNNWVVSGVKNNNAYVTDGTNGFIIYKSGHGFEVGDILSGTVNSCELTRYNGSAEFTNITKETSGLTVSKGGTIVPVTISIASLSGQNTGAVITFDSLKYNGTEFSDGVNTIKPYNTFITTLPTLTSGRDYQVTGVYIQYNTTKEIAPRSNDDIVLLDSPYLIATASKTTGISADGETITITVDTNVEGWTVTSDNEAFVVGKESGNTVPVVVSKNETDGIRTATITVSADGVDNVDNVDIILTQAKPSSGETIASGTTLWAENFAHFGTKTPSEAGTGTGTTIYGNATITYAQSSTNTKGYNENLAEGTAPELLLSKSNQTWTISGIYCDGVSEMTLTFLSNKTTFAVSSSTSGISVSGSQKSWTFTNAGAKTFEITIKNTGSSNARMDDVVLKVN